MMSWRSIPWSPNAPNAWSPYQYAPAFPPKPREGESLFVARQLEFIRPGLYEFEFQKVEPMKFAPVPVKFEALPPLDYAFELGRAHAGVIPRVHQGLTGDRVIVHERPAPRMRHPDPVAETWRRDGTVAVTGTLAQVKAWFEARGCTVKPDRKPMRDATGYRITDAYGRWVCDFIAYWRSGRCTAHCDWGRENQDQGDE